ncbi:MAG TPA: dTMP kinase [Pirellulales bacterium]|nr:dTMP kinase [Pirellulales bacterium]
MFISIDGLDGGGKSTQIAALCAWLREAGHTVVTCRDPGTTRLGETVREVLLERENVAIGPHAEMLLYMAARAQLVAEVIRPALAANSIVVSDRFVLANVVYQGHAGGLDPEQIWQVGRVATQGLLPDLTMVLDLSVAAAAARLQRPLDRMERRGTSFLQAVRDGFLREAAQLPDRVAVIDAARSIDAVQADIRRAVQARL